MNLEVGADSWIRPQIGRSQHWQDPAAATPAGLATTPANATSGRAGTNDPSPGRAQVRIQNSGTELEREDYWAQADRAAENGEMEFGDLLDLINPLHHIPVVGTLYREMTGDTIRPHARVMGGMLYGGPVGLVAAGVNAVMESASGEDAGGTAFAWAFGEEDAPPSAMAASDQRRSENPAQAVPEGAERASLQPETETRPEDTRHYAQASLPEATNTDLSDHIPATGDSSSGHKGGAEPGDLAKSAPDFANGEVLTGQAALSAFLSDLQGVAGSAQQGLTATTQRAKAQTQTGVPASAITNRGPEPTRDQQGPRFLDNRGKLLAHPTAPDRAFALPRAVPEPTGPAAATATVKAEAQGAEQGQTQGADALSGNGFESRMFSAIEKYEALSKSRLSGNASAFTVE